MTGWITFRDLFAFFTVSLCFAVMVFALFKASGFTTETQSMLVGSIVTGVVSMAVLVLNAYYRSLNRKESED